MRCAWSTRALARTEFDLAYVTQANRVFGKESPQGQYEGDSVLAHVTCQFATIGKLTAFGYWIDIEPLAGIPAAVDDASETFGLRFEGEQSVEPFKLAYLGSYATQREYADNPLSFDLDYYIVEVTGAYQQYSLGVGFEVLEGDGVKGFTTPLATLHRFQGWADKFLTTPVDGIEDRYVSAGISFKSVGPFDALSALATYHAFNAERTSTDYGSEIDAQVQATRRRFTALLKYADYAADSLLTDTTKFWVQFEYALK